MKREKRESNKQGALEKKKANHRWSGFTQMKRRRGKAIDRERWKRRRQTADGLGYTQMKRNDTRGQWNNGREEIEPLIDGHLRRSRGSE
ncbi:MAG: hypothetical protein EOP84_20345 [Verrucomicrobiaceae bacterium]|nr:MAG: hypothetical protein EOP84_20345 [Verrucomicrobiaceae bacterium]